MEEHNGGRWPIVSMDLGNKIIKNFKNQMKTEMTTPQENTTLQTLEAAQEGLQKEGKNTTPHLNIHRPSSQTQKTTTLQTKHHKSHWIR